MRHILRSGVLLLLALAGGVELRAQVQFVSLEPECRVYFSFTAVGTTASFDNRTRGCDFWVVSYSSFVFAGPLSLALQDAPNAAGSVPGAWVNFAGTVTAGVNPNVSLVGAETQATGYYPWIRMNLTATGAGAGLVVGTLYGWRTGPPSSVSILGTPPVNLAQYGGVAVGAANAIHVQGTAAAAAAPVGNPVAVAGLDYSANFMRYLRTDVGGRTVIGTAAVGADGTDNAAGALFPDGAGALNHVLVRASVFNGVTWDRQRGNTSGTFAQGPGAVGAAVVGNPVRAGIKDGAGNTRDRLGDSLGNAFVAGAGASGSAVVGNPVRVAGSDGTNTYELLQCDKQAAITLAGAGTTQIIAASGATAIRVCQISLALDGASNVQIVQGTGVNCAVGPANVTGNYRNVLSLVLGIPRNPFQGSASQAMCITLGSAVNGGGLVQYAQF